MPERGADGIEGAEQAKRPRSDFKKVWLRRGSDGETLFPCRACL